MKSIGLVPNLDKQRAVRVAKWLVSWLGSQNISIYLEHEAAKAVGWEDKGCTFDEMVERSDILVILGGDGTLLNAARCVAGTGIPLFGINLGNLGFLTEIEVPEIVDAFSKILLGEYKIEERIMLETRVIRKANEAASLTAFNDVVLAKCGLSRIMQLEVSIDGNYVDTYTADGLIVATPTGSTAYSLSAGGPIVSPYVDSLIITPICPHTLYARSLVISSSEKINVIVRSNYSELNLTADGQEDFFLQSGDQIEIKKSKHSAKLIKLQEKNFYRLLRTRLQKGGH